MLPQIPIWYMLSRGLSSPLNSSRLSVFLIGGDRLSSLPAGPVQAIKIWSGTSFAWIFGNKGKCLYSEVLAGTLRNFHAPELHVFWCISDHSFIYSLFLANYCAHGTRNWANTLWPIKLNNIVQLFVISGITINNWRTANRSCLCADDPTPSVPPWSPSYGPSTRPGRSQTPLLEQGDFKIGYSFLLMRPHRKMQTAVKPCLKPARLHIQYISITKLNVYIMCPYIHLINNLVYFVAQWLYTEPMSC
jgi:hypothetical protein